MTVFATISTVSQVRGRATSHGPRMIMGKVVDPKYYAALKRFMDHLSTGLTKKLADQGASDKDGVGVYNETGRKYDKILVSKFTDGKPHKAEVMFFVDRDTGEVLGPKSELAPNPKRYFGTVYESHLWDWSGESPRPYDEAKAGVTSSRSYGSVTHYEKA